MERFKKDLYQLFVNKFQHKPFYYNIYVELCKLFPKNNGSGKEECLKFIEEHFKRGSKSNALVIPWYDEYEKNGKHEHTVASYLLGLTVPEQLQTYMLELLEGKIARFCEWSDYRYTWVLTCLFHDIASCIEKKQYNGSNHLESYISDLHIEYTPFNHVLIKGFTKDVRFQEDLIEKYFHYRVSEITETKTPSIDHGILGGYCLFDRLTKNFLEKTENVNWTSEKLYDKDGVTWRPEHLDHFVIIADAIITHNLWVATSDNKKQVETYEKYGLSSLIFEPAAKGTNNDKRLSFKKYPLHFLLGLIDSLEPVKRFSNTFAREVLENIFINWTYKRSRCIVSISWNEIMENKEGFDKWKENVKDTQDWLFLNVDDKKESERKIEISFEA
jgi:hypothetical protein